MILVSGVRLPFCEEEGAAVEKARKAARLKPSQIRDSYIYKRSLDARHREDIRFVYTVAFQTELDERRHVERLSSPQITYKGETRLELPCGERVLESRPVVAGFGPAGMFCALLLARQGYRPIVLERGAPMEERVRAVEAFWKDGTLCPDTNVQFGEGGAGTFSDGKLTTRIGDPRCEWVIRELVRLGAPGIIARQQKPHIGTDRLRGVVEALRREVLNLGGEIHFHTSLKGLSLKDGRLCGIQTGQGELPTQVLVAALGHSARDSFSMLLESGVPMAPKAFSVGVRIEHLREQVDRALYGGFAGHPRLPAGEYQLSWREGERGVYTFCMCPGGVVVPAASAPGGVVVNGMSEFKRDGINSNSALVCSVGPQDYGEGILDGVRFQERLEHQAFQMGGGGYRAPVQTVGRFMEDRAGAQFGSVSPSYAVGVQEADFRELFPDFVLHMLREGIGRFGRRQKGFDAPDAVLTGVETRTSSPVRILRGEGLQSEISGLYPCGEGAGYAGGILSAAVDGIRVAQEIMALYRPMD